MAEIPRAYVDNLTRSINRVSAESQKGLADALASIDWTQDVATVRDQIVAAMQVWCGGATDMTAQLAAEFYDGVREIELGSRMGAVANSGRVPEATNGAVRAFIQDIVDGKPTQRVIAKCLSRLDYEVKVAASNCVKKNVGRDGSGPRYARVPSGSETCGFCIMLASRGPVYHSADTAGEGGHFHSSCDCRIVPVWHSKRVVTENGGVIRRSGTGYEGYDPDALFDRYLEHMADPDFRDGVKRAAERSMSGKRGTSGDDKFAWKVANGQDLTTYKNIHELTSAIRDASTYEEFAEVLRTIDHECELYGLSDRKWEQIFDLAKSVRGKLISNRR